MTTMTCFHRRAHRAPKRDVAGWREGLVGARVAPTLAGMRDACSTRPSARSRGEADVVILANVGDGHPLCGRAVAPAVCRGFAGVGGGSFVVGRAEWARIQGYGIQ